MRQRETQRDREIESTINQTRTPFKEVKKLHTCELIHSNKFLSDMEASSIECRRHGKTGIFDRRSSEDATLTRKTKHTD